MERLKIDLPKQGKPRYVSPSEGGRLNRSFLNYHFGIPDIDKELIGKKFSDLNSEFKIYIYDDFIAFILYSGKTYHWYYCISKSNIIEIKSHHGQNLNIRKDPKISGGWLEAVGGMGILGGVVAGTLDALTTGKKGVPENQIILGSLFEIMVRSDASDNEKIFISCTDKHKTKIEEFLKKIQEPKSEEKKGCYIASVCYKDFNAIEVIGFKKYRDEVLLKNYFGKLFVHFYYAVSPKISKWLNGKDRINTLIRKYVLDKLYRKISKTSK